MHLEARGLMATGGDVDAMARQAYVAATGDEDINTWIDQTLDYEEAGSS